jgi:transcription elongation factor Elf1
VRRGGWGRRKACTGHRAGPSRWPEQLKAEVACVECKESFETVTMQDGEIVAVVACPSCKTVFNRVTEEVLTKGEP